MRKIDADALMVELMDLDLDHVQANDYRELNQIIDEQPTLPEEEDWIPVSKMLPKILTPVQVTVKVENDYKVAHDWVYEGGRWTHYRDVVAWKPLPEPYREDT